MKSSGAALWFFLCVACFHTREPVRAAEPDMLTQPILKASHFNLVLVTTSDGASAGCGFIANSGNGTFLITNAHVATRAKGAIFKTLDGAQVQVGAPALAVGQDIFRMALKPGGTPLEIMTAVDQTAAVGDAVVVLGHSGNANVIDPIQGKIIGIEPDLVEVDAVFQPDSSGSPIIHLKTGRVIGVATGLTIQKHTNASKQADNAPILRRCACRLDSVKNWQPVDWQATSAQATEMEAVEKLTGDLVAFIQDLSKRGRVTRGAHTNPAIKDRIDQWLEAKSKLLSAPEAVKADQSLISFLTDTCQSDITAAQQHLTYDYFQRRLADEQPARKQIADVFSKISDAIRKQPLPSQ